MSDTTHKMTLTKITNVTHNTYELTFPKPQGLTFEPGQATEMTLLKEGWKDEGRPFTFTSQPGDGELQFVIKSYPSHDGVTEQIAQMTPGDEVQIKDVWGAIEDKGQGIFIAGGAGVTPFIPILRARAKRGELGRSTLVLAAQTTDDLILKEEWDAMAGLDTRYILSQEQTKDHDHGQITINTLRSYVQGDGEGDHPFYICGPDPMIDSVRDDLKVLGVSADRIITEDGH